MHRLCESAGFNGCFKNHSLRATRLLEANIDEQLIMQRTRHTSSAVREYKRVGQKLREETSDVLNATASIPQTPGGKEQKDKENPDGKVDEEAEMKAPV